MPPHRRCGGYIVLQMSVGRSVGLSVGRSVCLSEFELFSGGEPQ